MVRGSSSSKRPRRWAGMICLVFALAVVPGNRARAQAVVVTPPQISQPLTTLDEPTEATGLFEPIPPAGVIEELTQDLGLGVWTAQLGNGVLVHVRSTDARPDWVEITIVLGGGVIDESPAARGLTHAAVQVFERPATQSLDAQTIARRLSGRVLEVSGRARLEGITLRLRGDRTEMVAAMQLAHVLLTTPRIEASALGQWQAIQSERLRSYRTSVSAQMNKTALDAIYPPSELRVRPLSAERIESITLAGAQAWLDHLIATVPIEVGIVGDISTAESLELARVYLGSIAARPRVGLVDRADRETVSPQALPAVAEARVPGTEPEALVLVGYLVPEKLVRDRERVLRLAAQIIGDRLDTLREDGTGFDGSCRLLPRLGLLDQGLFYLVVRADPAQVQAARREVRAQLARMAKRYADAEEIERARNAIIDEVVARSEDPAWWSRRLGWWRLRGRPLEPTDEIVRAYEVISSRQVRDAVRQVLHPQRLVDLAVSTEPVDVEPVDVEPNRR